MTKPITIGHRRVSPDEHFQFHSGSMSVALDAQSLIYSRALIQANSGGGKTGLLRVIAEQVAASIPTIIIDKEGEFYTLREKLDLVLVGEQGELASDVRSAGLLARKLIELGASAVIDLSSLKADPQQQFVKNFLESLMELPRKLWHPTLIMIDEAHLFAPEKGMGESVSTLAVIDLMTRGRKRGFGGVLATTRLSKLHKNAADANNVFIGRTVLDVDQVRAGKNLGMKGADILKLRDLETREFYAYGPDLDFKGVEIFKVADAQTTMPKPGAHKSLAPPKASHVVLQIADKLKDIEQEAEVEIRDLNAAKSEITKLKRELRTAKTGQSPREQDTKRIGELTEALEKAKIATRTKTETVEKRIVITSDITRLEKLHADMAVPIERLETILERAHQERSHIAVALTEARELNAANMITAPVAQPTPPQPRVVSPAGGPYAKHIINREPKVIAASNGNLSSLHRQILNGIALLRDIGEPEPTIAQVGAVIGKSHNAGRIRGGFNQVHEMGYAEIAGSKISLTPKGNSEAVALDIRSRADIHNLWYQRLKGNELEFLRVLINTFPESVRLSDLGTAIGKDINAGRIRGALNALFEKGLATLDGDAVTASSLLFPPGLT